MDQKRTELLDRLYADGRAFDAGQEDRLNRRRNLEPESAQLLNLLLRSIAPERVLELGTSNGYSTIWIADALEATGGRLVTVEFDPDRAAQAAQNLAAAGVSHLVEQRVDDADGSSRGNRPRPGRWCSWTRSAPPTRPTGRTCAAS